METLLMFMITMIDTRHNPNGIDDPFTYRARDGFIGIGNLWADGGGTVYLQGHPVIPNPWGNVVTNGTTTTTTTDTTEKDGGDDAEPCGGGNSEDFKPEDCDKLFTRGTYIVRSDFTPSLHNCALAKYCYELAQDQITEVIYKTKLVHQLKGMLPEDDWNDLMRGLRREYDIAVGRGKGLANWINKNQRECDKYKPVLV